MGTQRITLGAQTSGDDDRTMPHVLRLRRILEERCRGCYCASVEEISLILRIGGDLQEFNFEGCDRIRRNRKARYITVDLGFPSTRWRGKADTEICEFLVKLVSEGLKCCVERLERDGEEVSVEELQRDFQTVERTFLEASVRAG